LQFRICFTKLKLLLLAVEISNEDGSGSHLTINPGTQVHIEFGTRGFFVAGSSEETKRFLIHFKMPIILDRILKWFCLVFKSSALL
jgi:hypothetical protein